MSSIAEHDHPEQHQHHITIYINSRPVEVETQELTFEQVVELSGLPTGPNIMFTISYRKAAGKKPAGSMVQGGKPVRIKNGTIFNVDFTDRS